MREYSRLCQRQQRNMLLNEDMLHIIDHDSMRSPDSLKLHCLLRIRSEDHRSLLRDGDSCDRICARISRDTDYWALSRIKSDRTKVLLPDTRWHGEEDFQAIDDAAEGTWAIA